MDDLPAHTNTNNAASEEKDSHPHHIILTDASVNEEEEREHRSAQRSRKFRKAPPWIEAACAILLVVITGTYTHYAGKQVTAMQQQLQQMKTASDQAKIDNTSSITAQKEIAQNALTASQQSVDKSLGATIDNFHLDQRAWVAAIDVRGIPELDKPWEIVVTGKNTGKTFARKFQTLLLPSKRFSREAFLTLNTKERESE